MADIELVKELLRERMTVSTEVVRTHRVDIQQLLVVAKNSGLTAEIVAADRILKAVESVLISALDKLESANDIDVVLGNFDELEQSIYAMSFATRSLLTDLDWDEDK